MMLSLSDSMSVESSICAERSGRIDSGGPRRRPTQLHLLELPQIPRASLSPKPVLTPFVLGTCRVSRRASRLLLGWRPGGGVGGLGVGGTSSL